MDVHAQTGMKNAKEVGCLTLAVPFGKNELEYNQMKPASIDLHNKDMVIPRRFHATS
jgi:hypothetical protein